MKRQIGAILLFLCGIGLAVADANSWLSVPTWCIVLCIIVGILILE